MKIELHEIPVKDVFQGYLDSAENGVVAYNGLLNVRPAFQREFVWEIEQIEKLFDSIMRGYPISSMLLWRVEGKSKSKWKFYKFIDSFVAGANDKPISNELVITKFSYDNDDSKD